MLAHSVPHIADVHLIRGANAAPGAAPDLIFEIPHGATATADFQELAAMLKSPLPEGLSDFFHVNTDVGAFELAISAAERFVALSPEKTAQVLRCRIPRTFIDCNRRIDATLDAFKEGGVTPGLMPWIDDVEDLKLLQERYSAYLDVVNTACAAAPDAAMVLLHTYSPRTVGVEVDADIVANLRHAYQPEIYTTWPLRPEFDVICHDLEGNDFAPRAVVDALRVEIQELGYPLEESATYPLHPSTLAYDHVARRPGRVLCVEVRRDLLADPFDPFVEMQISDAMVEPIATAFARAFLRWEV